MFGINMDVKNLRKEELIILYLNLKIENIELRKRINSLLLTKNKKEYMKEYAKEYYLKNKGKNEI